MNTFGQKTKITTKHRKSTYFVYKTTHHRLTQSQMNQIIKLFEAGERANDIAKEYGIERSTVYKVVNEVGKK